MKAAGIVLVILGVLMCIFTTVDFTQEKKVVDLGPIQINKKEHKSLAWPVYAGVGVGVLGIGLIIAGKKTA